VTVSLGAAVCPLISGGSDDALAAGRSIIDAADQALLQAKQAGRNRVVMGRRIDTAGAVGKRQTYTRLG
jgi:two-component system, cell cycle response regulator